MNYCMYSIYDRVAKTWCPPFSSVNDGTVQREFAIAVNSKGTAYQAHPEDYELYRVAEFDAEAGYCLPLERFLFVCKAEDLMIKEAANEISDPV